MRRRRRGATRAAIWLLALASGASVAPAAYAAPGAPAAAGARLEGYFLLVGRVAVAVNVPGERRGQRIQRTWAFLPRCRAGPCAEVTLVRSGLRGRSVLLERTGPGIYTGTGAFTAPLRCGGRVLRRGETVPFTITVRILQAAAGPSGPVAGRVAATYVSASAVNHTRCVAAPRHETVRYAVQRPSLR